MGSPKSYTVIVFDYILCMLMACVTCFFSLDLSSTEFRRKTTKLLKLT